jgi:hypothetical protein
VAVVLQAYGVEFAIGPAGEDAVIAVGGKSFDDEFAFDTLRMGLVLGVEGKWEKAEG